MFLWFVVTAVFTVHLVFADPRFDHRLLIVGALVPDLVDLPFARAGVGHSVTSAVGVLAAVMLVTAGRRPARRVLLGLPIGMLLHLVWDGAFTLTEVFWWPFSGDWGVHQVPSVGRGWWSAVLEGVAVGALVVGWRRFGLSDRARRTAFVRRGTLVSVVRPGVTG